MVLFGLTVIVFNSTNSNTAVSLLILSFLVPAVLFSAVAGVYVDRIDRRIILIATNLLRGAAFVALYLAGTNFALDPPAQCRDLDDHGLLRTGRARDDPRPRPAQPAAGRERHLHADPQCGVCAGLRSPRAACGQGRRTRGGHRRRSRASISLRRCSASPCRRPRHHHRRPRIPIQRSRRGRRGEGCRIDLRSATRRLLVHPRHIGRSPGRSSTSPSPLRSSACSASSGPAFAEETLGLKAEDFAVVVLPLGFGIVTGILLLNSYGHYFVRRRVIESSLIALGLLLAALSAAGPISRLLQRADAAGRSRPVGGHVTARGRRGHRVLRRASPTASSPSRPRRSSRRTCPRMFAGASSASSGCSCRSRASCRSSSSDRSRTLVGTTAVIFTLAIAVAVIGVISILTRGPLPKSERAHAAAEDPVAVLLGTAGPEPIESGPVDPERAGPADPTDRA